MRLLVPLVCALYIAGCLAQYDDDVDDQEDDTGDEHDMGHDEGGAAEGGGGATGAAGTPITSFDYSDPYFPQSLSVALITVNDERICNGALIERAAGEMGHFVVTTADCVWNQGYALNGEGKKLFKKMKEFHMSGDWRISELSDVKVEFGVTPDGEAKSTCQVQDVRINSYWPMDTASYHDPTHRRNDFAVLVLANGCEGETLDGAAYMPFSMAKPTLLRSPKHFVRAAYTEERQLMAYPETWLADVKGYGVKTKGAAKGITQQIGAPVFVRRKYMVPKKGKARATKPRKPMKKAPYLFGMYQVTNDKGAQITLRTASFQADVARLMHEGAGFSPLVKKCSMENVGAPVCWSECGPKKTCWVADDGSKKKLDAPKEKSRQTTKPCGLGDTFGSKVMKLCGKAQRGNGKASKKKKKTAAMMSWNGDEYEYAYGYEEEDVDDEAYAYAGDAYEGEDEEEEEDAGAAMYDELDEMFNAMFVAGYKQGVQEQQQQQTEQSKRRYRYQY